jgi:hypothetical protein
MAASHAAQDVITEDIGWMGEAVVTACDLVGKWLA